MIVDLASMPAPRRAVCVPGIEVVRHEHRGWTSLSDAERDRLSKRNFYRLLKRYATRRDLLLGERGARGRGPRRSAQPARRRQVVPSGPSTTSTPSAASSSRSSSARAQSRAARAAERASSSAAAPSGSSSVADGGPGRLGRRPGAVEVESQHEVRVEDEPAPLVGRQVGPDRLADDGEGRGQVEVVVDRRDEAVVEPSARLR